uniref:Uncharacterized protein n=1 Tax=Anguilla anguilla TaxID=7936 RepID=A0A0E9SGH7_ANGAN
MADHCLVLRAENTGERRMTCRDDHTAAYQLSVCFLCRYCVLSPLHNGTAD